MLLALTAPTEPTEPTAAGWHWCHRCNWSDRTSGPDRRYGAAGPQVQGATGARVTPELPGAAQRCAGPQGHRSRRSGRCHGCHRCTPVPRVRLEPSRARRSSPGHRARSPAPPQPERCHSTSTATCAAGKILLGGGATVDAMVGAESGRSPVVRAVRHERLAGDGDRRGQWRWSGVRSRRSRSAAPEQAPSKQRCGPARSLAGPHCFVTESTGSRPRDASIPDSLKTSGFAGEAAGRQQYDATRLESPVRTPHIGAPRVDRTVEPTSDTYVRRAQIMNHGHHSPRRAGRVVQAVALTALLASAPPHAAAATPRRPTVRQASSPTRRRRRRLSTPA